MQHWKRTTKDKVMYNGGGRRSLLTTESFSIMDEAGEWDVEKMVS
jgi:hypothetical protein